MDPEFYEQNFLVLESGDHLKEYHKWRKVRFIGFISVVLIMILWYILSFDFRIGYTEYHLTKNSFSIGSLELPDFMKGMDKFGKQEYIEAKEYFIRVDSYNENYEEALNMIRQCNEEIEQEGMAKTRTKD